MKKSFLTGLIVALTMVFSAQSKQALAQMQPDHAKWSFKVNRISEEVAELVFTAVIDDKWHLYSQHTSKGGPLPTVFTFNKTDEYSLEGKVSEPKPEEVMDDVFNVMVRFFKERKVVFKQKIKVLSPEAFTITGKVEYQTCDENMCLSGKSKFSFKVEGNKNAAPLVKKDTVKKDTAKAAVAPAPKDTAKAQIQSDESAQYAEMSLLSFFFMAFLGGLVALMTPCIYPMIPMTISYFMHNAKSRRKSIMSAMVYGISIVLIYEVVGTLVAVTLGESFTNWMSTHWFPNLFFFVLFLVFAASFFGMFEITLPSWMINKTDKQADKGGYLGAFFMAFTLVLVSFSCTAPIAGSILAFSAQGYFLKPIVGMLGYSLAFAIPFTLFAVFPTSLEKLPKSGGWLNSVKVVLGFLELALALKFFSTADQTYHWRLLDREVYLSLWIAIFGLMGFYLLGKLKFAHDSDLKFISVPRLGLAVVTFSFVIYMFMGMFGAPLKLLAGWLPPSTTQDFDIQALIRENAGGAVATIDTSNCEAARYADKLELPHGLKGYFDYDQALRVARKQNKPVFVDFTGHGCVNCRKMEEEVWAAPEVMKRLRNNFVIVALYVDDKTIELPQNEWYTSKYDGTEVKMLSEKNFDIQKSKFNANAQPYYCLLDLNGELLATPRGSNYDVDAFVKFLDDGLKEFEKRTLKK